MEHVLMEAAEHHPVLPGYALNWIGCEWVDAKRRSKSFNLASGEKNGSYADASSKDFASAIEIVVRIFHSPPLNDSTRRISVRTSSGKSVAKTRTNCFICRCRPFPSPRLRDLGPDGSPQRSRQRQGNGTFNLL
jgi:hypothetical protein